MKLNNNRGKLKCLMCKRFYDHLGSHIFHFHGITAREYKTEYELPFKMALISNEVYLKKKEAFEKDSEKYLKNLKKHGKKYQFKKGCTGQRRISQHERDVNLKRILEVNKKRKPEKCPVCKMIFDNVDSHLANKHKLLKIK